MGTTENDDKIEKKGDYDYLRRESLSLGIYGAFLINSFESGTVY